MYSDRRLTDVGITGLSSGLSPDKNSVVAGSIFMRVNAFNGTENGPALTVEIAAPCEASATIEQAERVLLDAALALVTRLSKESAETLLATLKKSREAMAELLNPVEKED